MAVPEELAIFLVIAVLLLALDLVAMRWGEDSRHELGDRNW